MISDGNIEKNVSLTLRFVRSQPPVEIILDGEKVTAVAVDMATVYSPEGFYRQIEYHGKVVTVESIQKLGIVLIGEDVKLCKGTYNAVPGDSFQEATFINARYWTTTLDALTEEYIC